MKVNLNKLLILDDNEQSSALIRRLAERAGYRTVRAADVAGFKAQYVAERPTLIAMDLILGDTDCTAALEFLASCRNEVPIILLTGHNATFLDVICNEAVRLGQKILDRVEKRRTMFRLEDILAQQRIPEVDTEAPDTPSVARIA